VWIRLDRRWASALFLGGCEQSSAMAEMQRLLRRRVAAKGWATRTVNLLSDLLDQKQEVETAGDRPVGPIPGL